MCFKFIPLIFAIVIGYVIIGNTHHLPLDTTIGPKDTHHYAPLLTDYSPVLGIVASVPAIFFALNGFQYPANLTSDMKNPKHLPISMLLGIIIVVVIYVLISLSLILGASNGEVTGLKT
jgi:amino acid transporter